jgi:hypothetical protein
LYHYLTQSAVHTESELFSKTMNGHPLTLPSARFAAAEIEALRKGAVERAAIRLQAAVRPPASANSGE